MRSTNPDELNALRWILVSCISVYILDVILKVWFGFRFIEPLFALSFPGLKTGFFWTPITYAFLHGNLFHILINSLVIFFIGRIIESIYGSKTFLIVYFLGVIIGGLAWLLFNLSSSTVLVGASAGGFALLTFFCLSQPNQMVTLLLFFIIPVNMKPKWILWGLLGIEGFMFLAYELNPKVSTEIASSAHLGGMLGGLMAFQILTREKLFSLPKKISIEKPRWTGKIIHKSPKRSFKVNITDRETLRKEVDVILDKINNEGFGSLTDEEKKILDQAKDILK